MKLKLTLMAAAATLALAYQAQAAVAITTTNYAKLNISAVIKTNVPETLNGSTYKWTTKSVKYSNKNLLDIFATWDGADRTTDPWKSAQLVIGFDSEWNGDALVVDKTGTNVLFDASEGIYVNDETNYIDESFDVEYYNDDYPYAESGTEVDADPGHYSYTDLDGGKFELYDDYEPAVGESHYIDIFANGSSTVKFSDSWDANDVYTTWNVSETFKGAYDGSQYLGDDSHVGTTTSSSVKASGHGKGYNEYFDD